MIVSNLADIVLDARLASIPDIARAARHADDTKQPLLVALIREIGVDEIALVSALQQALRIPLIDPLAEHPDSDVLRELPCDVCRRLRVLPLAIRQQDGQRVLEVAMADPTDLATLVELQAITSCEIEVTLVPLSALEEAIEASYRALVTAVLQRRQPFGGALNVTTQPLVRAADDVDTMAAVAPAVSTVPYHRLSDEADLAVRHQALLRVLIDKHVINEDEYEEAVRELLKRRDEGG